MCGYSKIYFLIRLAWKQLQNNNCKISYNDQQISEHPKNLDSFSTNTDGFSYNVACLCTARTRPQNCVTVRETVSWSSRVRVSPVPHGLCLVCVASSYCCCPPTLCSYNNEEPLRVASRCQSLSPKKIKIKIFVHFLRKRSAAKVLSPDILRTEKKQDVGGYRPVSWTL